MKTNTFSVQYKIKRDVWEQSSFVWSPITWCSRLQTFFAGDWKVCKMFYTMGYNLYDCPPQWNTLISSWARVSSKTHIISKYTRKSLPYHLMECFLILGSISGNGILNDSHVTRFKKEMKWGLGSVALQLH